MNQLLRYIQTGLGIVDYNAVRRVPIYLFYAVKFGVDQRDFSKN